MALLTPTLLAKAAPVVYQRFTRGEPDACWLWKGTVSTNGYGQLLVSGITLRAHRVVYALEHGQDPEGFDVCHKCDVPLCVNPAHLFLGTKAENQYDKTRKGRQARGADNGGGGKLTESDVREIRRLLKEGQTKTAVGRQFNVSRTEVYYIATGAHWSHIT